MKHSVIEIDGDDFDDYDSLVDSIGRHFSPSFEGALTHSEFLVSDRLMGGYGVEKPVRLVWKSSSVSKLRLDANKLQEYRKRSLEREEFFDEEGEAYLRSRLASEETLFEYFVEFLSARVDELVLQ